MCKMKSTLLLLSLVVAFTAAVPLKKKITRKLPLFVNGRPRNGFVGSPKLNSANFAPAPDQWFDQQLTHFDYSDLRQWKQRYFVNDSNFNRDNGPVFVEIGGEGTASPLWVAVGHMMEMAEKYGALVFSLEHRFYGQSHPLGDMSDDSLKFLSSEQALADLATFRNAMVDKYNLTDKNKWVMFGGSYPGALAAWFRLKYPHLSIGAIASSAPIFAQLNFPQYLEVVTRSLAYNSSQCVDNVNTATKMIDMMVETEDGLRNLSSLFKVCSPLTLHSLDVNMFASNVAGNFFNVVQYNKDNRDFEGAIGTNVTIDTLCGIMNDASIGDPLLRYAAVNSLIMTTYSQDCLDCSYSGFVETMQQTDFNSTAAVGGRQWLYQTCTEFGYYQTTDSSQQVFGSLFPLSFSVKQCVDIFGKQFNQSTISRGIQWTNTNYGGYGLTATKIVFPNGSIDPWHALSFTSDPSSDITAIYIDGTAHCANMYPPSPLDPPQLLAARRQIDSIVGKWLAQARQLD